MVVPFPLPPLMARKETWASRKRQNSPGEKQGHQGKDG